MHIPGGKEFEVHQNVLWRAGENRTSRLLELLAANQMEEADQMLCSSNPEYRVKVEMESKTQKALSDLQKTEEVNTAIANYVDAVHGRWLLFHKLFYQYAVEDIFSSSREAREQQDS